MQVTSSFDNVCPIETGFSVTCDVKENHVVNDRGKGPVDGRLHLYHISDSSNQKPNNGTQLNFSKRTHWFIRLKFE